MSLKPGASIVFLVRALVMLFAAMSVAACDGRPASSRAALSGCYVQVFEQPDHAGVFDFINGPHHYADLGQMGDLKVPWNRRIRSIKVGPSATVVLHTHANGVASSVMLARSTEHRKLPDAFDGTVSSLTVNCPSRLTATS